MKTHRLIICLALAVIATILQANPEKIPFRLAGNLIIIQGSVDGQFGNFILDTGVPNLVLNKRYFKGQPSNQVFQAYNGQQENVAVSYSLLEIGAIKWKEVYTEIIPMQQLEGSKSIPIHGLLGSRLFQNYCLIIDFINFEIELYPLDKRGENPEFQALALPIEVFPFKDKGGAPLVTVQIGEMDLKMTIDSGAEINLIQLKCLKKSSKFMQEQNTQNIGGLGNEVRSVAMGHSAGMQMGVLTCRSMRTAFVDLDNWNHATYGPMADGILGYEFLSQFQVAFNFKKREMYLWEQGQRSEIRLASKGQ